MSRFLGLKSVEVHALCFGRTKEKDSTKKVSEKELPTTECHTGTTADTAVRFQPDYDHLIRRHSKSSYSRSSQEH